MIRGNVYEAISKLRTDRETLERITASAGRSMTAEERFEQRVSWIYGQCGGQHSKETIRTILRSIDS